MEIIAYQKFLRVTPRKLRLVADAVRKDKPSQALLKLQFMHKMAAKDLYKVMKQAISNAVNNSKLDEKDLKTKHILIEEGPSYKRFRAGSRGRARMILKRTCHIKVVLEAPDKTEPKPVKETKAKKSDKKVKKESKK